MVEEEARTILAAWRSELVSDFGYEALDPGGLTHERLREALLQGPFLDPFRVVAVRGLAPRRAEALAPALASPPPASTRLLISVAGRLGTGSRLLQAISALKGRVSEHRPLRGRALQDWVARRARVLGLPPLAAATVGRRAQPDLGVLDSELRKLAAYREAEGELDRAVLDELVVAARPEEIFRLTDELLPRPTARAWRVLEDLLLREPPTTIAYRLARHLALVLLVRTRQDRGETLARVQAELPEHPFVVQKAFQVASQTPPERLEAALRALLDYEWEVKSGQIEAEAGLHVALARL